MIIHHDPFNRVRPCNQWDICIGNNGLFCANCGAEEEEEEEVVKKSKKDCKYFNNPFAPCYNDGCVGSNCIHFYERKRE